MGAQKAIVCFSVLALAYFASAVFVPFFLALFLAILLDPVVRKLGTLRIGREPATVLVVTTFILATAGVGWVGYRTVTGIAMEIPKYSERVKHIFSGMQSTSDRIEESTRSLMMGSPREESDIPQVQVVENYPMWVQYLVRWVGSLYDIATVAIFVPLLLMYFLFDRNNLLESFNAIAGKYSYLPKLNSELPKIIRAFIVGNFAVGIILSFAHGAIFTLLGLENWVELALISGFLNLIPLLGAPLAILLPFGQGVMQFHDLYPFVLMGVSIVAFHIVSNNWLLPSLIGARVNVNSVTLLFGLLFWGWLWGAIGFLLAIPMTALVKTFLESNTKTFALSNLMAARPRHLLPFANKTNPDGFKVGPRA